MTNRPRRATWRCPGCGVPAWASARARLICATCNEPLRREMREERTGSAETVAVARTRLRGAVTLLAIAVEAAGGTADDLVPVLVEVVRQAR